jgi:hypothetical protein
MYVWLPSVSSLTATCDCGRDCRIEYLHGFVNAHLGAFTRRSWLALWRLKIANACSPLLLFMYSKYHQLTSIVKGTPGRRPCQR